MRPNAFFRRTSNYGKASLAFFSLCSLLIVSCSTPSHKIDTEIHVKAVPEFLSQDDKITIFAGRGFGFTYLEEERSSMNVFIKDHGKPLSASQKKIRNQQDDILDTMETLTYPNYQVAFLNYAKRETWNPPESLLLFIGSVDTGTYLFGVKIGMAKKDAFQIFGLPETNNRQRSLSNKEGNSATLIFNGEKLDRIIWEYAKE
jgi:hypothetical protein